MEFAWPGLLLSLLILPPVVVGYVWLLRRRRPRAVLYPGVAVLRAAVPARTARRRHLPFAALLAGLACLTVADARPQVKVDVPGSGVAVILAVDVSGSMYATDIAPNRLRAAQAAVRDFVGRQARDTRVGLVVFSGSAQLAVPPTTQRAQLLAAIDTLTTGGGTMIGAAILTSLDAIAQIDPSVLPVGGGPVGGPGAPTARPRGLGSAPAPAPAPHAPEIVVLLTDGANTAGVPPQDAARLAAARGVRVYPIGYGTTRDDVMADETTLREVARITGGTYFSAGNAGQLQGVLADLARQVTVRQRDVEVTVGFTAAAAILVLLGVWAGVRRSAFPG